MENKKQTAVEWLCSQIYTIQVELEAGNNPLKNKIEQALKMEKQQIVEFADNYVDNCVIPNISIAILIPTDVPTYYKETYED